MPMHAVSESWAYSLAVYLVRLAQDFQQALGDELGAGIERGALDQDDKLVAAEACRGIAIANDSLEPRGDDSQEVVARGVSEGVVDMLEAVNVDV